MAKGTKGTKDDKKLCQHREQQLGLAHAEYDRILASGGKPQPKIIADAFGVPQMSLWNRINSIESKKDSAARCQKVLPEEETVMVQYLIETAKWGFPDTPWCTVRHANQILREHTGDPDATVGQNWLNRFLNRHTDQLSRFWSTTLTTVHGRALNEANVDHWYMRLQEIIDEHNISPALIFTMDESCCFLDKCTHKTWHIGPAKQQQQLAMRNENRETCTVMPIICADGEAYGPTVIFKGKHIQGKERLPNPLGASYVFPS